MVISSQSDCCSMNGDRKVSCVCSILIKIVADVRMLLKQGTGPVSAFSRQDRVHNNGAADVPISIQRGVGEASGYGGSLTSGTFVIDMLYDGSQTFSSSTMATFSTACCSYERKGSFSPKVFAFSGVASISESLRTIPMASS